MSDVKLSRPTAPASVSIAFGRLLPTSEAPEPRGEYDGIEFAGAFHAIHAPDSHFLGCRLTGLMIETANLRGVRLADTEWTGCAASTVDAARAVLRDVIIEGCRIGALDLTGATIGRLTIRDTKLDHVNLRGADALDISIADSRIGDLDLGQARVTRMRISGGSVESLRVSSARLKDIDVSRTWLARLEGLESVAGLALSQAQVSDLAPSLARHLGIAVLD